MTPDSDAFIQQSLLPQPSTQPAAAASTALTAVVLRPPLSSAATTATSTAATKTTVINLTQTPHSKPGLVILMLSSAVSDVTDWHAHAQVKMFVGAAIVFLILCH